MNPTRTHPLKAILSCTLAMSLAACSTTRSQYAWHDLGPQTRPEGLKIYTPPPVHWGSDSEGPDAADPLVAPGFLLTLHSLDDSKLNGDFRVDYDGNLALPYDMTVNSNGLTLSQLEKKLVEVYRPYFKTSTGIKLHVKERRYWVDVRGLVEKPGRYLVERSTSLDQVMGMAGGLDKDTAPRYVRIQKDSKTAVIDLNQYINRSEDRSQITAWYGGEILNFQRETGEAVMPRSSSTSSGIRLPIYMLGEVRKPGEYPARAGLDFVDFLTQANGFTEAADLKRIEVVRRTKGRLNIYEFSWNELEKAPTPVEGDVIFVHADRETKVERRIGIAAGVVSAIASIATAYVIYDRVK